MSNQAADLQAALKEYNYDCATERMEGRVSFSVSQWTLDKVKASESLVRELGGSEEQLSKARTTAPINYKPEEAL